MKAQDYMQLINGLRKDIEKLLNSDRMSPSKFELIKSYIKKIEALNE